MFILIKGVNEIAFDVMFFRRINFFIMLMRLLFEFFFFNCRIYLISNLSFDVDNLMNGV